jgi:subtilisin family serine protease
MCLLALVLALLPAAHAQDAARYWIVAGTEGGATTAPTPRAEARRALRGSAHAPAHPDRGVSPVVLDALGAMGIVPRHTSRWLGAVSADLTPAQAEAVAALPGVQSVRRTARLAEQGEPTATPLAAPVLSPVLVYGPSAAQLQAVRADVAIEAGRRGAGVLFGILDTRFDFGHPALAHIPAGGRLRGVQDFIGGMQENFHGLACSSIALGLRDGQLVGPAHEASVLAGTTEFAPTETHAEEDAFVEGLEWMEAQGADVVSVSLGYSVFDPGQGDFTYADMDGNTTLVTRAADMAVSLGVAVVVAAGNEGNGSWRYITAPADADSVITVGAATSGGTRASFSSVGPTFDGRIKPDVAALGVNVYVAEPGGGQQFGNGTSYAAPMVAGVVAQMLGARPSLTPIQVRNALRRTASQSASPTNELGWGVVDAVGAFSATNTEAPAPGVPTAWRLTPNVARPGRSLALTVASGVQEAVTVSLVDLLGRRVAEWTVPAGASQATVRVPDVPPGTYFAVVPDASALRLVVVR